MGDVDGYITITEAAKRARYSSTSALKRAAVAGDLQTVVVNNRLRLTRQEWLGAYLATLDTRRGPPRGQRRPRKEPQP